MNAGRDVTLISVEPRTAKPEPPHDEVRLDFALQAACSGFSEPPTFIRKAVATSLVGVSDRVDRWLEGS